MTMSAADDLRRHLLTRHHNLAALTLTDTEAVEQHHDEHHGTGGIRIHHSTDLSWDQASVDAHLAEAAELDGDPASVDPIALVEAMKAAGYEVRGMRVAQYVRVAPPGAGPREGSILVPLDQAAPEYAEQVGAVLRALADQAAVGRRATMVLAAVAVATGRVEPPPCPIDYHGDPWGCDERCYPTGRPY